MIRIQHYTDPTDIKSNAERPRIQIDVNKPRLFIALVVGIVVLGIIHHRQHR